MFIAIVFSRSLAAQGPKKFSVENVLLIAYTVVIVFTTVSSLGGVARRLATATTFLQDVDGGPWGAAGGSGSDHHLVDEDVNGGPSGGAVGGFSSGHHLVDEESLMEGPLGGATGGFDSSHHLGDEETSMTAP
jgi:hypothetical protein